MAQISTVYDYDTILSEVNELLELVDEYQEAKSLKKEKIYE